MPPFESGGYRGQRYREAEMMFNYGTTTVGFVYQGGIILCADSRVTQDNVILSRSTLKVLPVNKHIMATLAGVAADCSFWIRTLAYEARLHEARYDEPLSVKSAAKFISNVALEHRNRGFRLCMGIILAGKDLSGPGLYRVTTNGFLKKGTVFAVGSGATSALSILRSGHHFELTDEQAFDLGFRAVYQAALTDAYTGGVVSLHQMVEDSWRTVALKDCQELHENYSRGLNYAGVDVDDEKAALLPPKKIKMEK